MKEKLLLSSVVLAPKVSCADRRPGPGDGPRTRLSGNVVLRWLDAGEEFAGGPSLTEAEQEAITRPSRRVRSGSWQPATGTRMPAATRSQGTGA